MSRISPAVAKAPSRNRNASWSAAPSTAALISSGEGCSPLAVIPGLARASVISARIWGIASIPGANPWKFITRSPKIVGTMMFVESRGSGERETVAW